ncbi:urea ABC transporter ATP-binding protein UrtD [Fodinisporobacter ferrooxydans]|uniref:Urea ABC transporter ATP-binding protein UrtD n=1 Tax=Fodinisporobacter ferrooxydans TaxID=2901836 RepID=A0ABY4CHI1_9BACL|nr:urea ABC transporter ATP-binding protein UrtD [Alicyclobacillaceae bacterium MYW30-H2]
MSADVLQINSIKVEFERFIAIQDFSMAIQSRQLLFLIGPNGAGKTTLLDVICGKVKPVSGEVVLNDTYNLVKYKEHQIVELGIGRKFQAPSVFEQLTVQENMEIALKQSRRLWRLLRTRRAKEEQETIADRLAQMSLYEKKQQQAKALSHGEKQWLEIAMVLALEPHLILLDEPVAGMSKGETEKTGQLLKDIATEKTVVVVEHDMHFVRSFADRVTVMHEGRMLCDGSVEEIQNNPIVQQVYLGQRRERMHAAG